MKVIIKQHISYLDSFRKNFKQFEEYANAEILAGAPNVK